MEIGLLNLAAAAGAGLASVLSPCVLPVVPVIAAGAGRPGASKPSASRPDRLRPLLVVAGLSTTFMLMGVLSSLFGSMLVGRMRHIELAGGAVILLLGLLVVFDLNPFKRLYFLSNFPVRAEGKLSGLILGMALGVIWIPCIGPMLSGILTMCGTSGEILKGVVLLGFYSLGFSVPMLLVGYSSRLVQSRIRAVGKYSSILRYASGGVLAAFGLYIIAKGNFAF